MKHLVFLLLSIFTLSAAASGGGGLGGGSKSRPIDQAYEAGKNIYSGRNKAYKKLKICVTDSGFTNNDEPALNLTRTFANTNLELLKTHKNSQILYIYIFENVLPLNFHMAINISSNSYSSKIPANLFHMKIA